MRKPTRKLRHWKQRWSKNAEFIWARQVTWHGKLTVPGEPIPENLKVMPTKLRRFWESQIIHLAEFEAPNILTGQMVEDEVLDEVEIPNEVEIPDELEISEMDETLEETPEKKGLFAGFTGLFNKDGIRTTPPKEEDDSWLDGKET